MLGFARQLAMGDGMRNPIAAIIAFAGTFTLGVAATAEADQRIVVGPGGGGPHVQTFRLEAGSEDGIREASFFAYKPEFRGGVTVAGGLQGSTRLVVTGPASAGAPHVRIFDVTDPENVEAIGGFFAYEREFRGGVSVALGDVTGDGLLDVVTGPNSLTNPLLVRVFDISGNPFQPEMYAEFSALGSDDPNPDQPPNSHGVRLAAAPLLTSDPRAHVIVGSAPNGSHIQYWDLTNPDSPRRVQNFGCCRAQNFGSAKGGGFVAVGDVTGDGVPETVFGKDGFKEGLSLYPEEDFEPFVAVTENEQPDLSTRRIVGFRPYNPNFHGGVRVGLADVDGDGALDVITGAGPGGGPHVRAFGIDTTGVEPHVVPLRPSFLAYPKSFRAGIYVSGFDSVVP